MMDLVEYGRVSVGFSKRPQDASASYAPRGLTGSVPFGWIAACVKFGAFESFAMAHLRRDGTTPRAETSHID
jgi:hypothetical protein